ncbi:hypothetical protein [Streptomyces sp. NPDC088246]|uniref:hypothetical protein n=1 Tax=Streptomyces sp. NPDC088246 TaxID=3365842 RepID=UPI0038259359
MPRDAAAGERYGVIWAQTGTPTDRSHNLTMLGRVGVRMYIDVGPGGEPPSDFKIERLYPTRARDGRGEVRARIHNTGGRALDISGALSLFDGPGGLRAGPFSAAKMGTTLAPGDLAEAVVPLDARLPDGPWTAALTLKSGWSSTPRAPPSPSRRLPVAPERSPRRPPSKGTSPPLWSPGFQYSSSELCAFCSPSSSGAAGDHSDRAPPPQPADLLRGRRMTVVIERVTAPFAPAPSSRAL